jgi:hypothetical protein
VKLSIEAPNQKKVESWFKSSLESDFDKLYDYCQKYAENYFFEEGKWLYLRDLLKEVPIEQENWDNFLKQNTYYTFEAGRFKYLVHFFDYKLKDDTSPLVLERKKIVDLIRNKRKVALINKMRKDVVNESYETNNIEIIKNE